MAEKLEIRPQPGPQEAFLSTPADIAIYGGAAGGGKSFALLLEPLRHIDNPAFGAVIFRRQSTDITKEGALWDQSQEIYLHVGGKSREGKLDWEFPGGSFVSFGHLEHETSKYAWQGAQIALIAFDELTHFTKSQFFYMLSRNRSTSGVKPYIRATTNPDADSWVAEFISWWINQETGYPIPERSGVIRYMLRQGEEIFWADSAEELLKQFPESQKDWIKSVTFIMSNVYDNKILLDKDPSYLGNLMALDLVERERLLGGNWKIRASAGMYFKRRYFEIVAAAPADTEIVRRWDLAATEAEEGESPDWTVGLRMSKAKNGMFYVEHVERFQGSPNKVEAAIVNFAASDGIKVTIGLPQDPGQAGKAQVQYLVGRLAGYIVKSERETGDKVTRASPVSSQAEIGNIKIVRGPWNEAFLTELENFPSPKSKDDQVDALSGAFNMLSNAPFFYVWG